MKILWLSHSAGNMGAERVMIESITGLRRLGAEIVAVVPEAGELAQPWRDLDGPVVRSGFFWWAGGSGSYSIRFLLASLWHATRAALRLVRLLRRVRPDLVVTNTIVVPPAALAAKLMRIPHVWYIHEFGDRDNGFHFALGRPATIKLIDRLSKLVIVNSQAVRDHFAGRIDPAKMRLVYAAVEPAADIPAKIEPEEAGPLRLVLVGALSPIKRQEDAIRAAAILAKKGVPVLLSIVGPPSEPYADFLRTLTKELEAEAFVQFVGATERPLDEFAQADVALMCSRNEAFGRVTVEAMKMGLPVVGARSGGTAELIQDGINGFLYAACNSDELALALERMALDRTELIEMGGRARQWALENFNLRKNTADLMKVFEEAIRL